MQIPLDSDWSLYARMLSVVGMLSDVVKSALLAVVLAVGVKWSSKFFREPLRVSGTTGPDWYRVNDAFRSVPGSRSSK